MLSFELNQQVLEKLLELKALAAEYYQELLGLDEEEAKFLNHCALVSNIGSSTRIENAVLTNHEIEWLDETLTQDEKTTSFEEHKEFILNKLSKDKQRSIEEVAGCRELLITIYTNCQEFLPLREIYLREFHQILMRHYHKAHHYSGRYKNVTNRVVSINHESGQERIVLEPAAPGAVTEAAMRDLLEWYNHALPGSKWQYLVAIEFVFRFLAIHPFQDGNGRTGRALFLLSLLHSPDKYIRTVAPYLPIDRHIEKHRQRYYTVLRLCSEGKFLTDPSKYDYEPLILFFIKIFKDSLKDIDMFRNKYAKLQKLNELDRKILSVFKYSPEKRLAAKLIAEELEVPIRQMQRSIKRLCEQKFLVKIGQARNVKYQLVF